MMIYPDSTSFFEAPHKRITLMGMSNVGKTTLSSCLPKSTWYHYSVDYRLATAYLREDIVDTLKVEMMKSRHLAACLRNDAVHVDLNVTFSNLAVVSQYLGMLGAKRYGGLSKKKFAHRQDRHRAAEVASMSDVPDFIDKAMDIYHYPHFVVDASGSLCEIIDPNDDADPILRSVVDNTLLVYIAADPEHESRLIEAAQKYPKPLYYRPEFLEAAVEKYMEEAGLSITDDIDPNLFVRWVFPKLLDSRRPRYEAISKHGCVITREEASRVTTEDGFIQLIGKAIDRRDLQKLVLKEPPVAIARRPNVIDQQSLNP